MLPIAILGSSVYLVRLPFSFSLEKHTHTQTPSAQALHLVQTNLARERYADHAKARIDELEHDLTILRHQSVAHIAPEAPTTRIRRWWLF